MGSHRHLRSKDVQPVRVLRQTLSTDTLRATHRHPASWKRRSSSDSKRRTSDSRGTWRTGTVAVLCLTRTNYIYPRRLLFRCTDVAFGFFGAKANPDAETLNSLIPTSSKQTPKIVGCERRRHYDRNGSERERAGGAQAAASESLCLGFRPGELQSSMCKKGLWEHLYM